MFADIPEHQYSTDGGKTWTPSSGGWIAAGILLRIVQTDGTVIYSAHAEETIKTCDCCDGTGVRKGYHYVRDEGKGWGEIEHGTLGGIA